MSECQFCKGSKVVRDVLMRNEVCKHCANEEDKAVEPVVDKSDQELNASGYVKCIDPRSFQQMFTPKEAGTLIIALVSIMRVIQDEDLTEHTKSVAKNAMQTLVKILTAVGEDSRKISLEWLKSMGMDVKILEVNEAPTENVVH